MPYDSIGVIVFEIGDQGVPLRDVITYNVYERLLGLDQTSWNERWLTVIKEIKKLDKVKRSKAESGRVVPGTKPSHTITDYTGQYENPAYGIINITLKDSTLQFGLGSK